jgi:hypothetical protein
MNAKGKRKTLRTEGAKAIWRCSGEFGIQHALVLGAASGFHRSTAYRCVQLQEQVPEAWRSPIQSARWSREQIAATVEKIKQNPKLTLPELLDASVMEGFPQISLTILHRCLDHEAITYKQLTNRNQQRNAPENIKARAELAQVFLAHQEFNYVDIDEFSFNLRTQRHYRRARRGSRAIFETPANKNVNVSLPLAIQKRAEIGFCALNDGAFKSDGSNYCMR